MTKWDSSEIVSEKLLDRQQVKDVRAASERLLDYHAPAGELRIDRRSQQNPVFRESVYGREYKYVVSIGYVRA